MKYIILAVFGFLGYFPESKASIRALTPAESARYCAPGSMTLYSSLCHGVISPYSMNSLAQQRLDQINQGGMIHYPGQAPIGVTMPSRVGIHPSMELPVHPCHPSAPMNEMKASFGACSMYNNSTWVGQNRSLFQKPVNLNPGWNRTIGHMAILPAKNVIMN